MRVVDAMRAEQGDVYFELVFVDDGSTDGTLGAMRALTAAGAASLFNVIKGAILVVIVLTGARFALPPLKKMVDKVR